MPLAAILFLSCGPSAAPTPHPTTTPRADARRVVAFLGTSLTAGLGVDPSEAYPALIQARLEAERLPYRVVNAGVSGETSAGALRRIDWVLRQPVAVLVVETGANDGLRGQNPQATRANVRAILERAGRESPPPRLVLAGIQTLTNMGAEYQRRFGAIYPELARETGATLIPFLLEGIAGIRSLNQPDGIHPNPEGHRRIADLVWPVLRPLL